MLAPTALQEGLSLRFDVVVDLSTTMTARLLEASGLAGLVVVQSREELSLSGATETMVSEGCHRTLVAMNLGHESAKVFDVVLLDRGSVFHRHGGEDDGEVLGHVIKVIRAVVLSCAVLLEQLVAQARIKLVPNALVLIADCQSNNHFKEHKGKRQCSTHYGVIHLALNLLGEAVLLGIKTEHAKWASDKDSVHHVGELAVVSLRNILDDRDGVSDGNVMAKEACEMKASSASWYLLWSWIILQGFLVYLQCPQRPIMAVEGGLGQGIFW